MKTCFESETSFSNWSHLVPLLLLLPLSDLGKVRLSRLPKPALPCPSALSPLIYCSATRYQQKPLGKDIGRQTRFTVKLLAFLIFSINPQAILGPSLYLYFYTSPPSLVLMDYSARNYSPGDSLKSSSRNWLFPALLHSHWPPLMKYFLPLSNSGALDLARRIQLMPNILYTRFLKKMYS